MKLKLFKIAVPIIALILIFSTIEKFLYVGIGIFIGVILNGLIDLAPKVFNKNNQQVNNQSEQADLQRNVEAEKHGTSYNSEIKVLSDSLRVKFTDLFNSEHYGESAKRSSEQLFRIIDKFEKFKGILDRKLDKSEMTYERFFSATEEVYHNILDNLERIKEIYESVEDIDIPYLEHRIEDLKNSEIVTREMQLELSSLRQRKGMAKKELKGIQNILSINEKAITEIDEMRIKIGNLNVTTNRAQIDLDKSIADLRKMASRVNKYNK